eukprot:gene8059-10048_t
MCSATVVSAADACAGSADDAAASAPAESSGNADACAAVTAEVLSRQRREERRVALALESRASDPPLLRSQTRPPKAPQAPWFDFDMDITQHAVLRTTHPPRLEVVLFNYTGGRWEAMGTHRLFRGFEGEDPGPFHIVQHGVRVCTIHAALQLTRLSPNAPVDLKPPRPLPLARRGSIYPVSGSGVSTSFSRDGFGDKRPSFVDSPSRKSPPSRVKFKFGEEETPPAPDTVPPRPPSSAGKPALKRQHSGELAGRASVTAMRERSGDGSETPNGTRPEL